MLTDLEIDTALGQLSTGNNPVQAFKLIAHIREQAQTIADWDDLFACVLCHATGNRASKPYDRLTCYGLIDEWTEQLCREATEESEKTITALRAENESLKIEVREGREALTYYAETHEYIRKNGTLLMDSGKRARKWLAEHP